MEDLYLKIFESILDESDLDEHAIGGVAVPLGAGPTGKVKYRKGSDKSDAAYSKRRKTKFVNKSPSYYLKHGPERRRKRTFKSKKKKINESEAKKLETLLHDVVELVLRPYFQ